MKGLLIYLSQVILASGILYAYYHFFLRNKKFHRYNRFYILAATVISVLIPFLNIPVYFTQSQANSSFVLHTLSNISLPAYEVSSTVVKKSWQNWFTWENILYAGYILIASLVLTRIILSLRKIRFIIKNNSVEKIERIRFVNTEEPGTPFSFFRWLFWNKKIELQSEKGEQIFRHELFHIEEKHSRDIIFMELITVIFWINPFFYIMKKELKAIHEFLADQFAINENQKWEYAELLLMQALNTQMHLTNPFFHNQIKRRIAMITSSSKPGHQYLRKVLVLPVAAMVLALFAFKYKEKNEVNSTTQSSLTENKLDTAFRQKKFYGKLSTTEASIEFRADSVIYHSEHGKSFSGLKDAIFIINNKKRNQDFLKGKIITGKLMEVYSQNNEMATKLFGADAKNGVVIFEDATVENLNKRNESKADTIKPDNRAFEKVEVAPSFPGGEQAWEKYLERNLSDFNPAIKGAPNGTYTVFVQFVVDENGEISDVRALTHFGYGMEDAAVNSIKKGPQWVAAMQNGHTVRAYKKQPITFTVSDGKSSVNDLPAKENFILNKPKSQDLTKVLIIIDGKVSDTTNFHNLNPNVINSISVLKDAPAIAKYGDKGKNGVIEITTKKMVEVNLTDKVSEDNKIFEQEETPPSFPGGHQAWERYLERTLGDFNPADSGADVGKYTVMTQFIVAKDGSISDVKTLTNFGHGMEEKVIEIIKKGPKWEPAIQNGHKVNAYVKQPVTFVVQEEDPLPADSSLKEVTVTGYASEKSKTVPDNNQNKNSLKEVTVIGYASKTGANMITKEDIDRLSAIYPNPTTNTITIPFRSETEGKGEIRIYDEMGNLKLNSPSNFIKGGNTLNVNVSSLAKGIYIVQLVDANKKMSNAYKLVKQ